MQMTKASLYSNPTHPLVTVDTLVDSLSLLNNLDKASHEKILKLARKAILDGDLPSHDAQTTARIKDNSQATPLVTLEEFNEWAADSGMKLKLPTMKPKRIRVKKPAVQTNNWKLKVQAQASKLIRALRKTGANPTVHSILKDIHTWCVQNNVRTTRGVIPSPGYIRTHALGGKHWSPPP
jgi:hypothetical protein